MNPHGFDVAGRTYVVIGGAGLIGSAFSRALGEAGCNVVIADANKKRGAELLQSIRRSGGKAHFERVDIGSASSIEKLSKKVVKMFGSVHGVVNAAYPRTPKYPQAFEKTPQKETEKNLALMLGSNFSIVRAFSGPMKKQKHGSIVLLGSIYGIAAPRFSIYKGTDMINPPEYAAAKGGTIMLAKYFASLLGPYNIRVNSISPGGVLNNQPKPFLKEYAKHAKLAPGMLVPEDLAGALIFLFGDASKKVTGQNIVVDGGWTI
ncbi:SDR family oxidoreductase [Candidatus Kaiserbacteria bacterium]|nr:SDR family oxidoreductase [Candidatus Kaiserbacteria bacterium]